MKTLVGTPDFSFNDWLAAPQTPNQRYGQHLINTAPEHIRQFAIGKAYVDPFYANEKDHQFYIDNFIKFAELVWDVLDEDEMRVAIKMVLDEPGARGPVIL